MRFSYAPATVACPSEPLTIISADSCRAIDVIEHIPTARTSAECEACRLGVVGYDHEAVYKARPRDFDAQVIAMVRTVAAGAKTLAGVSLHPDAPRRAALRLKENDR